MNLEGKARGLLGSMILESRGWTDEVVRKLHRKIGRCPLKLVKGLMENVFYLRDIWRVRKIITTLFDRGTKARARAFGLLHKAYPCKYTFQALSKRTRKHYIRCGKFQYAA